MSLHRNTAFIAFNSFQKPIVSIVPSQGKKMRRSLSKFA